jgi:peptidoglycan/xylan/chitin deacetylase (PgdA/CDA1 family)
MGIGTYIKHAMLRVLPRSAVVTRLPPRNRVLALTFDDGPHPVHTPRLLDLLRAQNARATFFLVGQAAEQHPRIVQRIVEEGHELGNHSFRHVKFAAMPAAQQWSEIMQTNQLLHRHDGRSVRWFRPPQGTLTPRMLLRLMLGKQPIAMWSYDSLDYQRRGVDAIVQRFQARPVNDGDVVLLHDDDGETIAALELLLVLWRGQGYRFVALSEIP